MALQNISISADYQKTRKVDQRSEKTA